jgi:hypothetical protein
MNARLVCRVVPPTEKRFDNFYCGYYSSPASSTNPSSRRASMSLSTKDRADYLETLKSHGGEKAYHAGLELLQSVDSGKTPKPKVAKGTAKKAGPGIEALGSAAKGWPCRIKCGITCALENNPKKDPVGFATCVFQCMITCTGGGTGGTGGGSTGGGTGTGTGGGGSKKGIAADGGDTGGK